jgi:type I restriction enzyme S subunit
MNSNKRELLKLDSLCEICSSKRIFRSDYTEKGIPFYRSKEIIQKKNNKPIEDVLYISHNKFNEILKRFGAPRMGDILLTSVGTLGVPYLVKTNETFYFKDGNLTWFKNFSKHLDSTYLFYWLISPIGQNKIDSISIGSTQKAITINGLNGLTIELPSINEQKAISKILSTIDRKIELNNQINKNLEELAQTLYKRWFVDFEFPNEKGLPYQSNGGEMVESEIGLIPKGWEVKNVIDLFDFIGGSQPPKSEHIYEPRIGYVRFIQNRDYQGNPNHLTFIEVSAKNKLANDLDILIDKYGEVGRIRYGISGAYNVALAKINPKVPEDREFLRGYFNQESIRLYLENSSIASTRGSLNGTTFTGLKIPYPISSIKKSFFEFQTNILLSILKRKQESVYLSNLRDLLLPKLMSGEIEIPVGDDHGA